MSHFLKTLQRVDDLVEELNSIFEQDKKLWEPHQYFIPEQHDAVDDFIYTMRQIKNYIPTDLDMNPDFDGA